MVGQTDTSGYLKISLASGGTISGSQHFTGDVQIDGDLVLGDTGADSLTMTGPIDWSSGVAVTAGNYEIVRDADGTNQLHFNVPTGATMEWSVNDVPVMTLGVSALTLPANVQINADYNTAGDLADTTRIYDFLTTIDVNQTLATSDGITNLYGAINWTAGGNGSAILQGVEGVVRSQSADEALTIRGGYFRTYTAANADNPGATARTSVGCEISARAGYNGGNAVAPEAGTAFVGARIWMAPYFASDYANINNFHGLWIYNEHATQAVTNAIKIGDAGGGFTYDISLQSGNTIANTAAGTIGLGGALSITQPVMTSDSPTGFLHTAGAHTTLANSDLTDAQFALSRNIEFTGAAGVTTINNYYGLSLTAPQLKTAGAGALTVTSAYTVHISGAPTTAAGGGGTTITNPYSIYVAGGATALNGRVLKAQGADVASANDLTLGADGNTFEITGAVQINAITTANWQNGSEINLLFTSTPTVKHNTAGGAGTAVILLAGSADAAMTAGSRLKLLLSEIGGAQAWRETGRTFV